MSSLKELQDLIQEKYGLDPSTLDPHASMRGSGIDSLAHQIELFREAGRVAILDPDGFAEPSWGSLFFGLGVMPERYDPFVDHIDPEALLQHFARLRQAIAHTAADMPLHTDYIARHVKAAPV